MTRPLAAAFAALCLCACPPAIDTGDGGQGPIHVGTAGGLFIREGYAINIPRGALDADTEINLSVIDTGIPEVPSRTRISYGFRFSPANLTFKSPATVYLIWVPSRVPEAVSSDSFDMRLQAGQDTAAQLPGTRTDTIPFPSVEAQTRRLGLFWLTSPTEPNIDHLELDPKIVTLSAGATQQFKATVVTPTGETIKATVRWSVAPARVGRIDATGLFIAAAPGTATITATAGMDTSARAKALVPGTSAGPSSFAPQNPFPTGNDLHGGAIAPGGLGTVVTGGNGTVLLRSPAGSWTRLASSPGVTLTAVGGTTTSNAVAIGHQGSAGVLVELAGAASPTVTLFPPTDIGDLVALWFDGTSGMAVGSGNSVVIRRNGAWGTEYSPTFEKLLAVIGDGLGGFVVAGDLGSLYRWDPLRAVWDSLQDTRLPVKLDAAALVDAATGESWAIGGGKLWHFGAGVWSAEELPGSAPLGQATALGVVDGRVMIGGQVAIVPDAGQTSKGLVLVRDAAAGDGGANVSWTALALRDLQVPRGIFGKGSEGFVVGDLGAVWRWDSTGLALIEESHGFYGDVADLSVQVADVYAGVNECTTLACTSRSGHVMHWAAGQWDELGGFPSKEPVLAVAARSGSEILASTATTLFRWDGARWVVVPVLGRVGAIVDLQYCGTTVWAAGAGAGTYHGTAAGLSGAGFASPFGSSATAVQCPSPTEVWTAGNGYLSSLTDGGTWLPISSDQVYQANWQTAWSPGGGEVFAFGDSRYGVYYDTASLNAIQSLGGIVPDVAAAMWGASIDTLYVTGVSRYPLAFGFAARFDGVTWTLIDSGAERKGTAIHGTSASNLWIGTEGGGVLRAEPPR